MKIIKVPIYSHYTGQNVFERSKRSNGRKPPTASFARIDVIEHKISR
jgi:hypothetical protein